MPIKTSLQGVASYRTRDGSEIQELIHPDMAPCTARQSLARASVAPGQKTLRHRHLLTEEIYHILSGNGLMECGEETFSVHPGDSIVIPPGTSHSMANHGAEVLHFLCCCAPAYRHDDTELLE